MNPSCEARAVANSSAHDERAMSSAARLELSAKSIHCKPDGERLGVGGRQVGASVNLPHEKPAQMAHLRHDTKRTNTVQDAAHSMAAR